MRMHATTLRDWCAFTPHAADEAEARQEIEAANFYLTHAFVFALEGGAAEAAPLNQRLAARGCAKLLDF